jgi:hypothetical protein
MEIDLDTLAPSFRLAKERWSDAPTLSGHYQALADSFSSNSFGLIETVRSFIESVCLTILVDFGKAMPNSTPTTTEMFVETLKCLGLENSRGASKLDKVLSAYNRLADGLSDMRNENGQIAHGKDGFLDSLTKNHTRAFLLAGDTILNLLLSALEGKEPELGTTREPYDRFLHLHDRIDNSFLVEANVDVEDGFPFIVVKFKRDKKSDPIEFRVEPSRLLFNIDRTAYIDLLSISATEILPMTEELEEELNLATDLPIVSYSTSPSTELTEAYQGKLLPLKDELLRYLESLGIADLSPGPNKEQIVDSILATAESNMSLDWRLRENLQAKIRVGLKRVLSNFGIDVTNSNEYAEHLLTWFKMQAVDIEQGVK